LQVSVITPFVLTLLQPEATRPEMQGGWGGVYKWCRAEAAMGCASLELDPRLSFFDLLIIHIDADVASDSYSDISETPVNVLPLPCAQICPPPQASVDALRSVVLSWLNIAALGPKSMFCIPSKATEAWLAVAVASDVARIIADLECTLTMETRLASLPKGHKIKKTKRQYQNYAAAVQSQWSRIVEKCSQAKRFQDELSAHFHSEE
jgi:hypothetical protein